MFRKFISNLFAPEIAAMEQKIVDLELLRTEQVKFWRSRYNSERKDHLATMQREEQIFERLMVAKDINPTTSIREIEVEKMPHAALHSSETADAADLSEEEYQILWARAEETVQADAGEDTPITDLQVKAMFDLMLRDKQTYLTN